jgi:hypothetical protein
MKMSKVRDLNALNALSRRSAGPMKHRLEPNEGAKNESRDLLDEAAEEMLDDESERQDDCSEKDA